MLARTTSAALKLPSTVSHLFFQMMLVWIGIGIIAAILSLFNIWIALLGLVIFIAATVAVAQQTWVLLRARQTVLAKKDIPLLWGLVRLIAWDPVEGVLILRNKNIEFSDHDLEDAQGGVRFLYPILGEELALRIPLEVQTLRFADENVMTREYLAVSIKGTMKWRIRDIRKFYLFVSRELRSTTDRGGHVSLTPTTRSTPSGDDDTISTIGRLLNAAIEWMRVLAEEQTRLIVSRSRSGLLMAERISQEIGPVAGELPQTRPGEWEGGADGLADSIHVTLAQRLEEFGISVVDVSLQEIKLPEEIVRECIAACRAYYFPALARREAAFEGAKLKAQAEAIGQEAVATREVLSAAPRYGVADFVSQFLDKRLSNVSGAIAGGIAAAAIGASAAGLPAKKKSDKTDA